MQNQGRFMMASPASGFTARVMTRIAEHERARARRRALIGSALLVGAASVILVLVVWQLAAAAWILVMNPQLIIVLLNAFGVLAFWGSGVFNALWIAASMFDADLDPLQMTLSAVAVFAMAMLWVRVVTGGFQLSSSTNHVGGFRK